MAINLVNTTTNASIIPEVWSARFYEVLRATLPFINSISTDYNGSIGSLGDIINISTIADFDKANWLND